MRAELTASEAGRLRDEENLCTLGGPVYKRAIGAAKTEIQASMPTEARDVDVLALDEALGELMSLDSRLSRIVELKFFVKMLTQ
jgi:hypothetical protein